MPLTQQQKDDIYTPLLAAIKSTPSFSGRPTWLVANTLALVQGVLPTGEDPMPFVQEIYGRILRSTTIWTDDVIRQSWVAASGNSFQGFVRGALNGGLNSEGIRAISVSHLTDYDASMRSFLTLPARRRCVQASFEAWPDNDIMLLTRADQGYGDNTVRVFGILSCKTSFHARETESCFWAVVTRDTGVRMGLVTQDRNRELGTCARPTKARMLLEAYFDRVFTTNPRTSSCPQISPFTSILDEMRRWRADVVPNFRGADWSPS